MNKRNKKGFTITELVIVIVVIAILAAVLIPTFASLIKKANQSADIQLTKNLNTALSMSEATDGKPETFSEVLDAMREAGYLLANMNPTAEGSYLAWEKETNQIILIELTDDSYKVLYNAKKGYGEPDDSWYFPVKSQEVANTITAVLEDVNTELAIQNTSALNTEINTDGENTVHIDASITVDSNNVIKLDNPNANTTIDLGSSNVSGGSTDTAAEAIPFHVTSNGTLNLKNGTISAIGSFIDSDGKVMNAAIKATSGGVLNVEATKIELDNAAASVVVYTSASGGMKDVEITILNGNNAINASASDLRIEDCNVDCEYIAVQATYGADVVIDGGTYHTTLSNLLCVNAKASTITVEDGTFSCDNPAKTFKFYNSTGNKIVLKNGTFNGVAFEDLDEATLRGWCNLSDCAKGVTVSEENGAWVITVN